MTPAQIKTEALRALGQVRERLYAPDPVDRLAQRQLAGTVDYAIERVEAIQEVKRTRKTTNAGA